MNLLGQLTVRKGSTHSKKRIGRGIGSGRGGTSTKGHKGQKARSGGSVRRGFEGGQMPIHRRLPKFGFNNIFRVNYNIVNIDQLEKFDGEVTPEILRSSGLVTRKGPIKILGRGELKKTLTVRAHKFTKSAVDNIEKAGGKAEVIQ